jgi:hypothetical protein
MGAKRLQGVAIIRESSRDLERDGDNPVALLDIGLNRYGRRRYEFALEVRVPGIEPYTVQGSFRVPRRVENTSVFSRANKLEVGLELPVAINPDKPLDVHVDWDAFEALPGRKQAMEAAELEARNRMLGEIYARKHKQ